MEKMCCRAGDRILEVGVGTGLSLPLYDHSVSVVGIDISPEMLERARALVKRRRLGNIEGLWEMDAERMVFPDNSFDKVAAMYVVTVVPDPIRLVREMRRVCKPGGELFIVNHFQNPNPVIGACERLLAPLSRYLGFDPAFPLGRFLATTGLSIAESCPVNFFGFWTLLRTVNSKEMEDYDQDLLSCN